MQRKFLSNLAFVLLLNLLVKPVWLLVFDTSVQNTVGEEQFGIYYAILNFTFLFNILPDFGIANFNTRNIAMHNQLVDKHVPNIISLKFLLGVVYMLVALVVGFVLGYDGLRIELLLWLGFNQFLISFIQYLRSNLAGIHLFKQDAVVGVMDRTLMMVFCSLLLWGNVVEGEFNIHWFVYLQTAAYGITAVFAFILVLRKTEKFRLTFNWPFSLMILKKSLPFALLFILMSLYNRTDSVMVERLLVDGPEQAGIYAKGYRLLDAVNMFALLFAGLLLPIFARMIQEQKSPNGLAAMAFKLLGSIAMIGAIACFFYSEDIMGVLYKENIAEAGQIFQLLMLSFVAVSTTYVFGTLLTANNNMRHLNIMAICGVILNIGLNFILIPKWDAYGSAIATVITQFLTAGAQLILAHYVFKFKLNFKLIGTYVGFTLVLAAAGYFSREMHPNWMVNFSVLIACGGVLALLTRLINVKELFQVLREKA